MQSPAATFALSVALSAVLFAGAGFLAQDFFGKLGSAAASLGLSLLLVPGYGIMGAAAATALVLASVAPLFFVRRRLGFWPYGRRYVKPLVTGLAAAAATCAIRPALPGWEGLPALIIFAPLALTVFFAVLCSLGPSPGDRRVLASFRTAALCALRRRSVA